MRNKRRHDKTLPGPRLLKKKGKKKLKLNFLRKTDGRLGDVKKGTPIFLRRPETRLYRVSLEILCAQESTAPSLYRTDPLDPKILPPLLNHPSDHTAYKVGARSQGLLDTRAPVPPHPHRFPYVDHLRSDLESSCLILGSSIQAHSPGLGSERQRVTV